MMLLVARPFSFLATQETTVLTASNYRETVSLFANYTSSKGVSMETVETPLDPPLVSCPLVLRYPVRKCQVVLRLSSDVTGKG